MKKHNSTAFTGSVGIGAILAMIISWGLNHSIGWAIWHGCLGWLYVIYHWSIGIY